MSDLDTIRERHPRDLWHDECREAARMPCDTRDVLGHLDQWLNVALDRERQRDAARADADRLAEALDDANKTILALVEPNRDPLSLWQGVCGHQWYRQDTEDCPTCAARADADRLAAYGNHSATCAALNVALVSVVTATPPADVECDCGWADALRQHDEI